MSTVKRYLISSFDTFLAGFLMGIVPALNSLTINDLSWGTLKAAGFGIALAGLRGGWKVLREYLTSLAAKRASQAE